MLNHSFFVISFFAMAVFFFHSCTPGTSQRSNLSLSRATTDIIQDYTSSYYTPTLFPTAAKTCPHCGKLVEFERSVGECMFRELMEQDPKSAKTREMFRKTRTQLRGEASDGYDMANILLGFMAESGLYSSKDIVRAARYYRIAADKGTVQGRASLAAFWIRLGENLPAAADLLKKAIRQDPRNVELYMNLGEAYRKQNKMQEAFFATKKAYYHSPVNSMERNMVERVFVQSLVDASDQLGFDASMKEIDDLIYLAPRITYLSVVKADLYAKFNKFDEAEKEYSVMLVSAPDNVVLRLRRAEVRSERGNFKGAHDDVDYVLKKMPHDLSARMVQVHAFITEKKFDSAVKAAEDFLKQVPDKSQGYFLRALVYEAKHDYKSALEDLNRVKKMNPKEDIQEYINRIQESLKSGDSKKQQL